MTLALPPHGLDERLPPPSTDALRQLDWLRFIELARAVLLASHHNTSSPQIAPDASASMTIAAEADPKTPLALLHFLPWHQPDPQPQLFPGPSDHPSLPRILVAQGFTTPAATQAAETSGIEIVDAPAFIEVLSRLHPQLEHHLWQLAHGGHPAIPSCPSCRAKLVLVDPSLVHTPASAPSRHLRRDSNLPGDLVARSLTIARGAHVQALGVIWANHIHLKGALSGNILCSGKISLGPSARLSGFVKARAIQVAEGGSVDATTEIVRDADSQPLLPSHLARWVCPSPSLSTCATIALPQRDPAPWPLHA